MSASSESSLSAALPDLRCETLPPNRQVSMANTHPNTHTVHTVHTVLYIRITYTRGGGAAFRNRQEKTRPDGMVAMFSLEDTPRSVPCFDPIEQGNCINWEVMILAVGTHRKRTI